LSIELFAHSTKQTGTGIGLALCNEIVSNHDGQLRLINRENGGLSVNFSLTLTAYGINDVTKIEFDIICTKF
jgi:K+-sensing histidine kinase KdpD